MTTINTTGDKTTCIRSLHLMVFPPRGREFAVTQTHWFRMRDGKIAEHWANRDDLTMGEQLGWTPPTPVYLATMLLARRRARRTTTQS